MDMVKRNVHTRMAKKQRVIAKYSKRPTPMLSRRESTKPPRFLLKLRAGTIKKKQDMIVELPSGEKKVVPSTTLKTLILIQEEGTTNSTQLSKLQGAPKIGTILHDLNILRKAGVLPPYQRSKKKTGH